MVNKLIRIYIRDTQRILPLSRTRLFEGANIFNINSMSFIRTPVLSLMLISSILQHKVYCQDIDSSGIRYYCGKNLVQALSVVCQMKYNKPNGKRYLEDNYDDDFNAKINTNSFGLLDLLMGEQFDLYDSEQPRYRVTKGVVNECCYKPCGRATLQTYCS